MSQKNTAEYVFQLISPLFEPQAPLAAYELIDVEYKKEGANWYLRVFLDKDKGITLDDCQHANRYIEDILDTKDPIPTSYFLEVSSPGIERPLKKESDFMRFSGQMVRIKTYAPFDGKKEFVGKLKELKEQQLIIYIDSNETKIPYDMVASVNLTIE